MTPTPAVPPEMPEELVENLKCIGVGEGTPRFDGRTLIFSDREFRAAVSLAFNAGRDAQRKEDAAVARAMQCDYCRKYEGDAHVKCRAAIDIAKIIEASS